MPSASEIVEQFMRAFIEAWPRKDASDLMTFFSTDAVYHNIPLDAVRGREAICQTLETFMGMGGSVSVDVAHVLSDGQRVAVERVDHFTVSGKTSSLAIMGIFELQDGLITSWRDYFDLSQFELP